MNSKLITQYCCRWSDDATHNGMSDVNKTWRHKVWTYCKSPINFSRHYFNTDKHLRFKHESELFESLQNWTVS